MEKKIKTLYILSIAAILAFLGMQLYWLYGRYEYSLSEYENISGEIISSAIAEYNNERAKYSVVKKLARTQSSYQMNTDVDSAGNRRRNVTVTTKEIDGRKILGIAEKRNLTSEEMKRLQELILDSLDMVDAKIATVDASSAPSDGVAWNAMRNFDNEIQSPFTAEGIDSILKKSNLNAEITLILQDSVTWEPVTIRHSSVVSPRFKVTIPYSELERKAVMIECKIPSSEILRSMGWTLALAVVLSLFLILCLVWQIRTIVKLTRLDKMRNSFITTMIHELKRPISTLKMCVSGIDNDKMMNDDQMRHELVGETRIALDNLSAYFSKLRDITFNNVEQIPLNITTFNLFELVDNVIASIQLPSSKIVVFENNVPGELEVSADRSHLMNILTNLIENAIKYSGENVMINICAEAISGSIKISVEDNGNGIASSDKSKIFNRFYRAKASTSDIPGMGLGLTYVKLLTDAHGGEITVESTEGVGSSFSINLPQ
ncbi:MAG: HAMP domain-containing histidine kinase [Muribaculaceae bacterium]|nr:HAMP domain-containing histidine kinase [Muribaculaceae bacterium]